MKQIFLSLGSNSGNRSKNLAFARHSIVQSLGPICYISPVYETEPWGFHSSQNFLNQVVEMSTGIEASRLLATLQQIETEAGRRRSINNGYESRTLDIDILFFGHEIIGEPELTIPHPRMHLRKFVLQPLSDIAPSFVHPTFNRTIAALLNDCEDKTAIWEYKPANG